MQEDKPSDVRARLFVGLLLGTILSLVFVSGFVSGTLLKQAQDNAQSGGSDPSLRDFLSAYHLVTAHSYFRPFDRQHLIYAAIDGMLAATGDPHTLFLPPQENRVAQTELNGTQFSGIGAIVVPEGHDLEVVAPIPRAPAARAGIQAGDIVTKIDGQPVARMSGTRAVARIHGRAGTAVRLTIVRAREKPFSVEVKRAVIPPITAYGRLLGDGLGDIQVLSFGDTTSHEVADALSFLTARHVHGIILDLRGNPGGYVEAAQGVASLFLSHGVVAYEEGTDKRLQPLDVIPGKTLTRVPVVVLVDSGTASAAEITAGALHDNGRAIIMGTRTYGKGSMQSVYTLTDGSSIRITDRLWLTPKKRSIQGVGIEPDITVQGSGGNADPQLAAAERYLIRHEGR